MANLFVRSSDGNNADDGSTWALAKADSNNVDGITSIDAAGDTIFYSSNHVESISGGLSISLEGTVNNPVKLISVDDTGDPVNPTTSLPGATVGSPDSGTSFTGSCYVYGLRIETYKSIDCSTNIGQNDQFFENTVFKIIQNWATQAVKIGYWNGYDLGKYTFKDCTMYFTSSTQHSINVYSGLAIIENIKFDPTSVMPDNIFYYIGSGVSLAEANIKNSDLSNLSTSFSFVNTIKGRLTISNCKLPSGWIGQLISGLLSGVGSRASMYNCDDGATHYNLLIQDYTGSIVDETILVKSGGATDGSQAISIKMTTNANANEYVAPLITDEFVVPQSSVGTTITVRVPFLHDSVTALNNSEIWLEVSHSSDSASPLYTIASSKRSDILATPTNYPASSDTFTTTGMTNPMVQDLSVTFTPQIEGKLYCKVFLAKPNYTVYVDEKSVVT